MLTDPNMIHYIPTKPYLAEGSIADQVTYPLRARKSSDRERILDALKRVKVAYLDERGGGIFETISDSWDTKLSLGEQQRIAVARLLLRDQVADYRFAFLDECTSAVALDGEEEIYKEISSRGLCCVTASQKPWLLQFHTKIIQISEKAHWEVSMVPEESLAEIDAVRLPDVVYQDARQVEKSTASYLQVPALFEGVPPVESTFGVDKKQADDLASETHVKGRRHKRK